MTQPRPLYADDYETILVRAPKALQLNARIREAARASGETPEELLIARLNTSLGPVKTVATRRSA